MDPFLAPEFKRYFQQCPLVLVDIGSSGGLPDSWKPANKYLQVIGFEPDNRAYKILIKSPIANSIKYLNTGLYSKKTFIELYLTKKQQVSSMLKPNRNFLNRFPEAERFDVLRTAKIQADTLDNQLKENEIKDVDFIKIDTQGSELFILQGAEGVLSNAVFGLEIEVEFHQMYQDQPLFSDIDNYIRKIGFQLFDLRPCYWKRTANNICSKSKGQIIFADAIYLRSIESYFIAINKIQDKVMKKSKLLKAFSICILYNHHDYAL